jgi:ABC-type glutathione transport system ATPase component
MTSEDNIVPLTGNEADHRSESQEKQAGPVPAIECRNVWKIYGKKEKIAHQVVKTEKISKEVCLEKYGCVIGVVDASFTVNPGEIFCIMGLSGSPASRPSSATSTG